MPVACIGFQLVFQFPVTMKGIPMSKRIRLACSDATQMKATESTAFHRPGKT